MSEILDKVRKLQALQERAGTEQEAALASLRIQEILTKHNLDIGVLELEKEEGTEMQAGDRKRHVPDHWTILAHAVNELFDVCHFTRGSDTKGWKYSFIGLRANVEAACLTFPYLIDAVESLLNRWKQEPSFERLWVEYSRKDYRAFRLGASRRILELIQAKKRQPAAAASQELVRVGNALAKRIYDSLTFENTRMVDCEPGKDSHRAFAAGYHRGHLVDPHGAKTGRKRIRTTK